ncbi:hypothetical protein EYF80_026161 [Liparis tanakae]|uniref:Uncharacterized protein n=1 Tax=Liparis tanakae TaxID=230148 RepID=A0A4Z2HEB2_9TELE|nr:hypothetical protein EYF80_026161 [Liparis tanakae]
MAPAAVMTSPQSEIISQRLLPLRGLTGRGHVQQDERPKCRPLLGAITCKQHRADRLRKMKVPREARRVIYHIKSDIVEMNKETD